MTYGRARRRWPVVILFFCVYLLTARPAHARAAPASELTVTLLSVGPDALQVQDADGRAREIKLTSVTWVLRQGLVVLPRELTPGETLRVRLGRGKESAALLVCDEETADAMESHRRRPLSGTILSVSGKVWTVQPADGPTPLPICLSARTGFRAGGASVATSAFGVGASVMITTRGLANGLLAAVSVSDAAPEASPDATMGAGASAHRPSSVFGIILEARPDLGLLTLQDAAGASRTVALDAGTRVKFAGRSVALGELAAGMRVRVRLGARQDVAGHPVTTSVSASAAKALAPKKKRR